MATVAQADRKLPMGSAGTVRVENATNSKVVGGPTEKNVPLGGPNNGRNTGQNFPRPQLLFDF